MKSFSITQIVLAIFIIGATLLAFLIFSGAMPGLNPSGRGQTVKIEIWGTFPESKVAGILKNSNNSPSGIAVTYKELAEETFETELVNSLASGKSPDIVILPSSLAYKQQEKFLSLSNSITEREFLDSFVDGTDILIIPEKIIALPFLIDPMVLYWNRDLFRNEAISETPKYWDEFLVVSQKITKKDGSGNLIKSGAALGTDSNVSHPKEILSLLILQKGSPIFDSDKLKVNLAGSSNVGPSYAADALRFFLEFSNSQKASYSWSPAFANDSEAFAREDLAMYFGLGSEFENIKNKNPHLNFDIAPVPQIRDLKIAATYGNYWALAIPKASKNPKEAYIFMNFMTQNDVQKDFALKTGLAPARRSILSLKTGSPISDTIWKESIKMKSWLEADIEETSKIFSDMIKSAYSGRKTIEDAARDGETKLRDLYR